MEGYIQLHRQLLDSYQFSNPNVLKLWIWMLLKANHKPKSMSVRTGKGYSDIQVERGQFIFGRSKAANELDMDESMIYRILKKLENQKAIVVKSNNQYSLITICKYDQYNKKEKQSEQPTNSPRTANEQPMNTNNNVNKDNNDKNKTNTKDFVPPTPQQVSDYFFENGYSLSSAELAYKYYSSNNWNDRNGTPVKNWKLKMLSVWFKEENKIKKREFVR